ncbi:MAG: Gfo/Idh/MocA family oxidoreductase [Acidobacteria bacterium]|nr:Gfo/Idh/MocA family oxidoreductase [Acidobacteriota bacterium]
MSNRRAFLETGAGLLILRPETAFGSQANSTPELGLIGCGNRGVWITGHFLEQTGAKVTAIADAFEPPLAAFREKFGVSEKRSFVGLDGFREMVKQNVDAVVIESPPYFHPDHAMAAVEAGKHVYCAKPVASDVPGTKRFVQASELAAKKKLNFLVDFQTRNRDVFKEAVSRVHNGGIGDPVFGHIYYHAGRNRAPETTGLDAKMAEVKGWLHSKKLSGDIIVEQNVHVLDVGCWYLKGHPLKAIGTCGQMVRKVGDVSDVYQVTYWFDRGVKVDFSSVQFTKGYSDLCMRLYGSAGTCDAHYNGFVRITGEQPWNGSEKDNTFTGGAIQNIKDFIQAVKAGNPVLNNGAESAQSNYTGILGRMAAARERVVTWDEMMASATPYDGRNDM